MQSDMPGSLHIDGDQSPFARRPDDGKQAARREYIVNFWRSHA
jgi:hypothetical protein